MILHHITARSQRSANEYDRRTQSQRHPPRAAQPTPPKQPGPIQACRCGPFLAEAFIDRRILDVSAVRYVDYFLIPGQDTGFFAQPSGAGAGLVCPRFSQDGSFLCLRDRNRRSGTRGFAARRRRAIAPIGIKRLGHTLTRWHVTSHSGLSRKPIFSERERFTLNCGRVMQCDSSR
ncbi:hypothetical protein GCM10023161_32500 [Mycobacterium paraffinicum]|uniref:Uncharacterized protein n=1 Tax=Mycobacterium paraffinicum TaxID=53378 RepID=A0ABP8RQY5_9MYCO